MKFARSVLIFLIIFCFFLSACQKSESKQTPNIILWAWERPEDLEFIDTDKIGVAFISQTIQLKNNEVELIPRRQPLKVLPETYLIAVTRIETSKQSSSTAILSEDQKNEIIDLILKTKELPNVSAIQIDFDVTSSERDFYKTLLSDLRLQLPENYPLSITALASWCVSDNWIKDLPIDEAIPMAFVMGADDKNVRSFLASGKDWQESLCQKSYGISLQEPLNVKFKENRKFYIFNTNPQGWKASDLNRLPKGVN